MRILQSFIFGLAGALAHLFLYLLLEGITLTDPQLKNLMSPLGIFVLTYALTLFSIMGYAFVGPEDLSQQRHILRKIFIILLITHSVFMILLSLKMYIAGELKDWGPFVPIFGEVYGVFLISITFFVLIIFTCLQKKVQSAIPLSFLVLTSFCVGLQLSGF